MDSITDEQGVVTEHLSYDAHGKRRLSDWNAGTPAAPSETPRGFTGHEHLDGVGLIHMNGRVYDPTLGRFLSADPNVQAADDTQSFNRYSYVKNNPLSYTDPSGFFFKKLFKKIKKFFSKAFKAITSFVKKALQNEIVQIVGSILATYVGGPLGATAFSGLVTLANGGDLGQALLSAAITFAVSQATLAINSIKGLNKFTVEAIAAKAFAHGVVGGVASVARGGEFRSGFLGSAFGSLAGSAAAGLDLRGAPAIAFASVSGGVGEELGGGKFKNGALSGAFSGLAAEVASSHFAGGNEAPPADDQQAIFEEEGQAQLIGAAEPGFGYVNLLNHEDINGSHTIREHVGKTDAFLRMRMRGIVQGNTTIYKVAHSTFSSLGAANKLVSATLSQNLERIVEFISNPNMNRIVLQSTTPFASPTGRMAYRTRRWFRPGPVQIKPVHHVIVVFQRNPEMPSGFNIHTSYPAGKF